MKILSKFDLQTFVNMGMLYAGKTSGILVAVVFFPMYSRLLGAAQFGVVAVILSLQSLLVMMDFGMSNLISRDFAIKKSNPSELLKMLRNAEFGLCFFYLVLFVSAVGIQLAGGLGNVSISLVLWSIIFFCVMVLQNIYYCATIACGHYSMASFFQVAGGLARTGLSVFVLIQISQSAFAFVLTQALFGILHYFVTRFYFFQLFNKNIKRQSVALQFNLIEIYALFKRGKSLALLTMSGAAVLYLDKPIVSAFMSAADVAPYFLAVTLCMGSISVVASPISQFFQPKLLNVIAEDGKSSNRSKIIVNQFTYSLLLATLIPTVILWLFRSIVIDVWIRSGSKNDLIAHYVAILLPGVAIGLLGFVPYGLLLSAKDFKFQARISMVLTLITLISAGYFAFLRTIDGICYTYSIYNISSTLITWLRTMYLPSIKQLGKESFLISLIFVALLIFIGVVSSFLYLK